MKRCRILLLILTGTLLSALLFAQIPVNPNKTDAQGKRQGKWTILFDNSSREIQDQANASYYRQIEYRDDHPIGFVQDFYMNGVKQLEVEMKSDRPAEIFHGSGIWYNARGEKEALIEYAEGVQKKVITYSNDGEMITDSLIVLNRVALFNYQMGMYDNALKIFDKARIKAKYEEGTFSAPYLNEIYYMASTYQAAKDYASARVYFMEIIEAYRKTSGEASLNYTWALQNIAKMYLELKDYKTAENIFTAIVQLFQTKIGTDYPEYEAALQDLADLYHTLSAYSKEEPILIEILKIKAQTSGKETSDYSVSLNALGMHYLFLGTYDKAEQLLLETKNIRERVLGKEHELYAHALNNLGLLYEQTGDFQKSEYYYLETLALWLKLEGKENFYYATSLNNLAVLYMKYSLYPKSEPMYLEARAIWKKIEGEESFNYVNNLNNLAELYRQMGNYSKAMPLFLEVIKTGEKILPPGNPPLVKFYINLASLHQDLGDYTKAEEILLKLKPDVERVVGKEHELYALILNNMVGNYLRQGNYSEAELYLMEVNSILKKTLGADHPNYVINLENLAVCYSMQGKYVIAETTIQEAIDVAKSVLGEEHPTFLSTLYVLAEINHLRGHDEQAEPLFIKIINLKLKLINFYFPSLSEKEKQDYYASNRYYFTNFEIFCMERYPQNPAILNELYNLKLATKGLLFNASNKMRQRILNSKDKSLIELYNDWQSKKDWLAKVYQMPLAEKEKKGMNEKKMEEDANSLEKSLSLKSELFGNATDIKQDKWEDIRMKLKSGEVAIEMVRTSRKIKDTDTTVYVALIVTPQTQDHPDIVVLENGDELEGKFSKYYRNAVKQKVKDELSYNQYWKPIADKIKGAKKVYFSADGVYNQINLNTLYNPATGKYVIDEIEVQVVTSTKDLLINTKISKTEIKDATLFGYPNYNNSKMAKPDSSRGLSLGQVKTAEIKTDSAARFFNGENINELPGTKVEVQTIESLLLKKSIAMHKYLFDEATETEIKKLNNPQVLHIATHGFFLADFTAPKENERGFAGMETKKIVENPLLRSGLLFAGVKNAFTKTGNTTDGNTEDGILTAYEAMSLDLDQTDLVVMSACETGLGVTANGEGVYGLQRAFQVAGAKSVLMSLWTVSDEATQKLMTMFYENWLAGKTPREAFRTAQLSLRTKYPEPYFWGAFVLVGN